MVYRLPFFELVVPVNKDHIGILQFFERLTFLQHFGIQHTTVVSCPADLGAFGISLHLNVHFLSIFIHCIYIQGNVASTDFSISDLFLPVYPDDLDLSSQDDPEDQFGCFDIFIKHPAHQVIIKQCKFIISLFTFS